MAFLFLYVLLHYSPLNILSKMRSFGLVHLSRSTKKSRIFQFYCVYNTHIDEYLSWSSLNSDM